MSMVSEVRPTVDVVGRECLSQGMLGVVESVTEEGLFTVAVAGILEPAAASAVPLPRLGEEVRMRDRGTLVRGVWVGLRGSLPRQGAPVGVRLLVGAGVVEGTVAPGEVDCRNSVVGPVAGEARAVAVAVAQMGAEVDDERAQHARWLEGFAGRAREAADDAELCSRFDDFMEEEGLERRRYRYTVEVVVTTRVAVDVEAESEGDAQDSIDREQVQAAVPGDVEDWRVAETFSQERVN